MSNKAHINHRSTKTFHIDGKWFDRPRETQISICECGTKYISTREGQNACIPCFTRGKKV